MRYRQAFLGTSWAVIQPLVNMLLFAGVFGKLAHMPSNGIPYPLFSYCALLPWTYFSVVIGLASSSLTNNQSLITKVYFPRVLLPAGTALAGLLDFTIAAILLTGMMIYYHVKVTWLFLFTPLAVLLMVMLTLGVSMFLAALSVRYRDVKYVLPFLIQIFLFATPIIYPVQMVPQRYRPLSGVESMLGHGGQFSRESASEPARRFQANRSFDRPVGLGLRRKPRVFPQEREELRGHYLSSHSERDYQSGE